MGKISLFQSIIKQKEMEKMCFAFLLRDHRPLFCMFTILTSVFSVSQFYMSNVPTHTHICCVSCFMGTFHRFLFYTNCTEYIVNHTLKLTITQMCPAFYRNNIWCTVYHLCDWKHFFWQCRVNIQHTVYCVAQTFFKVEILGATYFAPWNNIFVYFHSKLES